MKSDTSTNGTKREHESLEEKLLTLMGRDEKARSKQEKLSGGLTGVNEEIARIAAEKVDLLGKLGGLYKKQASGKG